MPASTSGHLAIDLVLCGRGEGRRRAVGAGAATVTSPDVVTTGGSGGLEAERQRLVQSPFGHSFASKQPTYPLPAKSSGHAPHVLEPGVLMQAASLLQPPFRTRTR